MPPIVARLAVEMSGANWSPSGRAWRFRSSSTQPGWTRARRPASSISSTRLKYLDVSRITPDPIDCPACDVPPPRGDQGHIEAVADPDRRHDVRLGPRYDHAQRHDLVDAGIGGIQGTADAIKPDLAGDGFGQGGVQAGYVSKRSSLVETDRRSRGRSVALIPCLRTCLRPPGGLTRRVADRGPDRAPDRRPRTRREACPLRQARTRSRGAQRRLPR